MSTCQPRFCFTQFQTLLMLVAILLLGACSFNPKQQEITESSTLQKARFGHASISDGRYVYLFGGSGRTGVYRDVEIIDSQTGEVRTLDSKLIPRRYHAAVWDGADKAYLIGGSAVRKGRWTRVPVVEVFDLKTHEVTHVAQNPLAALFNTAVYLDGKIYVFGGSEPQRGKGLQVVSDSWVYDIANDSWSLLQNMPVAKETKAVVYEDRIYLFGGYDYNHSHTSVERYDPASGNWTLLPDLPVAISAHSVTVKGDSAYMFGNYDDLGATYHYDFTSQQLEPIDLGYIPRRHTAIANTSRGVYVTGGTIQNENGAVAVAQRFSL